MHSRRSEGRPAPSGPCGGGSGLCGLCHRAGAWTLATGAAVRVASGAGSRMADRQMGHRPLLRKDRMWLLPRKPVPERLSCG